MSVKNWVEVFSTTNEGELMVVEGLLASNGILCRRQSRRVPQFPFSLDGLAEVRLEVPDEDAARAMEILNERPEDERRE